VPGTPIRRYINDLPAIFVTPTHRSQTFKVWVKSLLPDLEGLATIFELDVSE
jgi:hypothetical protein